MASFENYRGGSTLLVAQLSRISPTYITVICLLKDAPKLKQSSEWAKLMTIYSTALLGPLKHTIFCWDNSVDRILCCIVDQATHTLFCFWEIWGKRVLLTVSQCHPLPHTNVHWLTTVHKLMWAKKSGKISLFTNYRIFWNPQIRYKRSPIWHWVSKLSQKWLLKVKNGMKSDNNRSHVNKSLHLGLCSFWSRHSIAKTSVFGIDIA